MILALLLLLVQPAPDARAEAERLFSLGQALYAEGDAAGAIAAFEGAEATGWTSAALHYDLGTACLATGELGCAVLHLERARRLRPSDERIAHNLALAHERADVMPAVPSPVEELIRRLGWPVLGGLALALYLATLGLAGYWLWGNRADTHLRRALVVLVPVALGALVVAGSAWWQARAPEAIVLAPQTELRAAPTAEAPSRASLRPGQRIRLGEARSGWQAARLPDGTHGWLPIRAAERIEKGRGEVDD